jgi:hypothetical protein
MTARPRTKTGLRDEAARHLGAAATAAAKAAAGAQDAQGKAWADSGHSLAAIYNNQAVVLGAAGRPAAAAAALGKATEHRAGYELAATNLVR